MQQCARFCGGVSLAQESITLTLMNKSGLHARPASIFVQTAKKFQSKIIVKKGDKEADAKSILSVLALGAEYGDTITIIVDGNDAPDALAALVNLVKNKFGEE